MIINKSIIDGDIGEKALLALIARHEKTVEALNKLECYYLGKHDILSRKKDNPSAANRKIVGNYAKYITTVASGYLLSQPVKYSAAENADIKQLTDEYYQQTISTVDAELSRDTSIFGRGYELVYADEDGKPRSAKIDVRKSFIVYDDTVKHNKRLAVRYYTEQDIDGKEIGLRVEVYTENKIKYYKAKSTTGNDLKLENEVEHFFGAVPVIEYANNYDKQGDFEQLISLIDAYNLLMSDRVNDKEQFVDAILLLLSAELTDEQINKLKEERVLMLPPDSDAKYLERALNEQDVEVLRKALESDIHKFSMIPNLGDENFVGNASGVAIRYKLFLFNQLTKDKERYFERGLKERFALYNRFLNVKHNMKEVPEYMLSVIFTRNLPVNESELAAMIAQLQDIVSDETLIGQLPFVDDPKEEIALAAEQRKEKLKAVDGATYKDEENEQA